MTRECATVVDSVTLCISALHHVTSSECCSKNNPRNISTGARRRAAAEAPVPDAVGVAVAAGRERIEKGRGSEAIAIEAKGIGAIEDVIDRAIGQVIVGKGVRGVIDHLVIDQVIAIGRVIGQVTVTEVVIEVRGVIDHLVIDQVIAIGRAIGRLVIDQAIDHLVIIEGGEGVNVEDVNQAVEPTAFLWAEFREYPCHHSDWKNGPFPIYY